VRGDPVGISPRFLASEKVPGLSYGVVYVILGLAVFVELSTCDTQTHDDSIYRANIASCGKKISDDTLWSGLTAILHADLNHVQWLQASLLVQDGGIGVRRAQTLAPSAFLASAASTFQLQQSILSDSISLIEDLPLETATISRSALANASKPDIEVHIQKSWDR